MTSSTSSATAISAFMRLYDSRAEMKLRHRPIDCSMGASARPRMIDAAIMPPDVSSLRSVSQAPSPMIEIWTLIRTNFETAATQAPRSADTAIDCWIALFCSRSRRSRVWIYDTERR